MNPTDPHDQPDLTHYALGELPAHQQARWEQAFKTDPTLQRELTHTQEVIEQLQTQAPLHTAQLSLDQRQRVLTAAAAVPLRRPIPAGYRRPAVTPSRRWTVLDTLCRSAAVVALAAISFWLGQNSRSSAPANYGETAPTVPPTPEPVITSSPPTPQVQGSVADVEPPPLLTSPAAATLASASDNAPAEADIAPPASSVPTPVIAIAGDPAPPIKVRKPTHILNDGGFVDASRQARTVLSLTPERILPGPVASVSSEQFAKPLSPDDRQRKAEPTPSGAAAPLFIHSWRSEVASCPWSEAHRLLRITIQLPADQPAATLGNRDFPLALDFDANNVRSYRFIGSQTHPAPDMRHAGQQILWFEFEPNGAPAGSRGGNGKHIATLEIPEVRFTTRPTGPFNSRQLTVLDEGTEWNLSRDSFRLDAARIGLALLLDGQAHSGELNQQLILDLLPEGETSTQEARERIVKALKQLSSLSDMESPSVP